jgi:Bacteriocin-protection, YdeI or OmpD-Associated/Domain of unknown function (DUF1905)
MRLKYTIQKFVNGMHYIMLDAATVKKLTVNNNKRVLCTINNAITIHAAIMPKKEGGHFIVLGSTHLKKIKSKAGMEVTAVFKKDTTEFQFDIAEEFTEVLATDAKAKKIFDGLTDGNKRGLIYLVNMLKSSDKKIERALKIADKIKAGITAPRLILK